MSAGRASARAAARALALVGTLALVAPTAGAEAMEEPSRPSWLSIEDAATGDVDPLVEQSLDLPRERADALSAAGHGYTDLLRQHAIHLAADGGVVRRVALVRRFLSHEGARNGGTLQLSVGTALERLVLERAEIRLPDGGRRRIDLSGVEVATNAAPGIFSDLAVVSLPFPGVVPGASTLLIARFESRRDEFPLPWSELFHPQQAQPIELFSVFLSWDEGVPEPSWAASSGSVACRPDGLRRLRCEQAQLPEVEIDPDVANWFDLLPELALGTPSSWGELASRELALVRSATMDDPRLDAVVATLGEGAPTARQRLARIHRFVADRVRYVAFEHGTGAVAPRPAATTLEQGFGDCKDKVALFLTLARKADLDAWPVLVATGRFLPGRLALPSWQYFDHMIACVAMPDEKTVCVDPTASAVGSGRLPAVLQGAVALDLGRGPGVPRTLDTTPIARRVEIESENRISCDGATEETTVVLFEGGAAEGVRSALRPMSESGRERWALDLFRDTFGEKPDPSFEVSGVEASDEPLVLRGKIRYPTAGSLASLDSWAEPDAWLLTFAHAIGTGNRHHPYRLAGLEVESRIRYRLCPEIHPKLAGADLAFEARWGELRRDYEIEDGQVEVHTVLSVPTTTVAAEDLPAFSRFLRTVLAQTRIWFGWSPAGKQGS